tara:strand:+ start:19839 stop:20675 length:837 start_codon:yes stop_codon:yes gene_type:complete
MPGSDMDWNRAVGNHEGEHCNTEGGFYLGGAMDEEARADRSAIENLIQNDLNDVAFAYKDWRHLGGGGYHATGVLLGSQTLVTEHHAFAADNYKNVMKLALNTHYLNVTSESPMRYGHEYDALLKENPNEYFSSVHKGLEEVKAETIKAYKDDPDFVSTHEIILLQTTVNYINNYESAYRRRFLGEDTPETEPVEYIPDSVQEQFFSGLRATNDFRQFDYNKDQVEVEYKDAAYYEDLMSEIEMIPVVSMEGDLNQEGGQQSSPKQEESIEQAPTPTQ